MIEPMKRVVVLATAATQSDLLHELRQLGVLHLLPLTALPSRDLADLAERVQVLERALERMDHRASTQPMPRADVTEAAATRGLDVAHELLDAQNQSERTRQERDQWLQRRQSQADLGRFDPHEIHALRAQGLFVRLYECSPRAFKNLGSSAPIHVVSRHSRALVLACVSRTDACDLPLRERPLPEFSLDQIEGRIAQCDAALCACQQRFDALKHEADAIRDSLWFFRNAIAFEKARAGMGAAPGVCFVLGFCPARRLAAITAIAARRGWAVQIADPGPDDPAPTLIRPTRWGAWFQPVLDFIGIAPGYREPDASGALLVFFSLFVGMIVGDAGYGCVLLAATALAGRRLPDRARPSLPLFYLLSLATIAWGALTGMWFGIPGWAQLPFFRSLVVPELDAFAADARGLMRFCLVLGAIHLSVAHALAALRLGSWRAWGELGWIAILWGGLGLADWLLLGAEHPALIAASFLAGAILVPVFGEQGDRGFVRGLRDGIVSLPLSLLTALGCFSDLMSYIRLFAVGLATKEVAAVFNGMASQVGFDTPAAMLGSVLVVAFGHSLNIALAVLGILVHGLRLNLLEFARHLNVSWSGIPYDPFRLLTAGPRFSLADTATRQR